MLVECDVGWLLGCDVGYPEGYEVGWLIITWMWYMNKNNFRRFRNVILGRVPDREIDDYL